MLIQESITTHMCGHIVIYILFYNFILLLFYLSEPVSEMIKTCELVLLMNSLVQKHITGLNQSETFTERKFRENFILLVFNFNKHIYFQIENSVAWILKWLTLMSRFF